MYKVFLFAALIAVVRAGNLVLPTFTYNAAPLSVGSQHQSVVRTLDGNSAVSHYSKAVDSAFSSVRKYDTRITNDAKLVAPATFAYAAPSYGYAAAAPSYSYAAAAPIVKTAPLYSYAAPSYAYSAAPLVKAAPALSYVAPAYGYHTYAPSASYVAHSTFTGLGAHY